MKWFLLGFAAVFVCGFRSAKADFIFGEPIHLEPPVNTSSDDGHPCVSTNGLELRFSSKRPDGRGSYDIWVSMRPSTNDVWGVPVNLGPPVNSRGCEHELSLSADGLTLFFQSNDRPGQLGGEDLRQAPIIPIVDLNDDGIVDVRDVDILADHWGENYPLCDIGRTPWGDGIVDVQDLLVLAEYLLPEPKEPGLIANWTLDETQGSMARDSVSGEDALVLGDPLWLPTDRHG